MTRQVEHDNYTSDLNRALRVAAAALAGVLAVSACAESGQVNATDDINLPAIVAEKIVNTIPTLDAVLEATPEPTITEAFDPSKIFVSGLIVSVDEPPAGAVEDYIAANHNGVVLWEAEEARYWPLPAVAWLDHDGTNQYDITAEGRKEPMEELAPNVVAVQIGDEPSVFMDSSNKFEDLSTWTNFSYWAPLATGAVAMEPALDEILEGYQGDVLSNSEYNLGPAHYMTMRYFALKAQELGIPAWQYLNAYGGVETAMTRDHTESDLAWSAFSALAMGYRGFIWFTYQFGPVGHIEATAGGGSVMFDNLNDFENKTPHWQTVADINKGLLTLGAGLDDLEWIDACLETAPHTTWQLEPGTFDECEGVDSTGELLVGSFADGWQLVLNGNHTHSNPDRTGFDGEATITFDPTVYPYGVIGINTSGELVDLGFEVTLPAGWPILVHPKMGSCITLDVSSWCPPATSVRPLR